MSRARSQAFYAASDPGGGATRQYLSQSPASFAGKTSSHTSQHCTSSGGKRRFTTVYCAPHPLHANRFDIISCILRRAESTGKLTGRSSQPKRNRVDNPTVFVPDMQHGTGRLELGVLQLADDPGGVVFRECVAWKLVTFRIVVGKTRRFDDEKKIEACPFPRRRVIARECTSNAEGPGYASRGLSVRGRSGLD